MVINWFKFFLKCIDFDWSWVISEWVPFMQETLQRLLRLIVSPEAKLSVKKERMHAEVKKQSFV